MAYLRLLALCGSAAHIFAEFHRYCVVGAGPGGLQLSHYFDTSSRDYIVLEQAATSGSFFQSFPRWRQLISINKKSTGKDGLDYTMRHDWNSLLSEPSHSSSSLHGRGQLSIECPGENGTSGSAVGRCFVSNFTSTHASYTINGVAKGLQFRDYSDIYYPEADKLVQYLQHWYHDGGRGYPLHVRFNNSVQSVQRHPSWTEDAPLYHRRLRLAGGAPRFRLHTSNGMDLDCTYVIWAAGLQTVTPAQGTNMQAAIAAGWVKQYATAPTELSLYANKSILILGRGNAAFEFANNLLEVAAKVHLMGRDSGRVRLSHETHYPGDVRSVHSHLLETYLLKSMDGMAEVRMTDLHVSLNPTTGRVTVRDVKNPCERDEYGREDTECLFRHEYDHVISCSGWKFDSSPFDPAVRPAMAGNGKHPATTTSFESTNVPGLYFAGTLMHGLDHKKSSGGFIHGFRYLIRALHRVLEEEEQATYAVALGSSYADRQAAGLESNTLAPLTVDTRQLALTGWVVPMPFQPELRPISTPPALPTNSSSSAVSGPPPLQPGLVIPASGWPRRPVAGLRAMAHELLVRINNAAGPYQMFGSLTDVLVLRPFTPGQARGFTTVGTMAACHEPWSFYDPAADTSIIHQAPPPWLSNTTSLSPDVATATARDAVIDSALSGWMLEEVPVGLVHAKVKAWREQMLATDARAAGLPHDPASSSLIGLEYVTLTLEFGAGSSSHVTPEAKARGAGVREWARDPFSLNRANVSLAIPENSHFLHPVLRYYHTGISAGGHGSASATPTPVAEVHVIEDFHIDFTHHVAHVLPITRMLQDVGARRAQAALRMGQIVEENQRHRPTGSDSQRPIPTSGGFTAGPLAMASRSFLRSLHTLTPSPSPDHVASMSHTVMGLSRVVLWIDGHGVKAGSGWFNKLSRNVTHGILHGHAAGGADAKSKAKGKGAGPLDRGVRMAVLHFIDPFNLGPSKEETELTAWTETQARAMAAGTPHHELGRPSAYRPDPAMTPAQAAQKDRVQASLDAFYRRCSLKNPGVPIFSIIPRSGGEAVLAKNMNIPSLPFAGVYETGAGFMTLEPRHAHKDQHGSIAWTDKDLDDVCDQVGMLAATAALGVARVPMDKAGSHTIIQPS